MHYTNSSIHVRQNWLSRQSCELALLRVLRACFYIKYWNVFATNRNVSLSLWSKCAMFFICFILTEQPTRRNQIKEVDQNQKNTFEKTLSCKKLTSFVTLFWKETFVIEHNEFTIFILQRNWTCCCKRLYSKAGEPWTWT